MRRFANAGRPGSRRADYSGASRDRDQCKFSPGMYCGSRRADYSGTSREPGARLTRAASMSEPFIHLRRMTKALFMPSGEEVLAGILPSPTGRGAGGEGPNVRNSLAGGPTPAPLTPNPSPGGRGALRLASANSAFVIRRRWINAPAGMSSTSLFQRDGPLLCIPCALQEIRADRGYAPHPLFSLSPRQSTASATAAASDRAISSRVRPDPPRGSCAG